MPDQFIFHEQRPAPSITRPSYGGTLFFYASLLIFLLLLAGYGGLVFLNRAQGLAQAEILAQIEQKRQDLRPELVQELFALEKRLMAIRTLLENHILPSRVFAWLESQTHPRVYFQSMNFNSAARKLQLPGSADSLRSLNEQIGIFEQNPELEKVEFGGLSFAKDAGALISFQTTVVFKPAFFQSPQVSASSTSAR